MCLTKKIILIILCFSCFPLFARKPEVNNPKKLNINSKALAKKVDYDELGNIKDDNLYLLFPKTIWYMHMIDFHEYKDKELGYSIGYNGDKGFKATVYVYNKGITEIPNGHDNKLVQDDMAMVSQALRIVVKRGTYENLKITGVDKFSPEESKITFLRNTYTYIENHKGGVKTNLLESQAFVTGYGGNFIKIRYTYPKEHMVDGRRKADVFAKRIALQLEKSEKAFRKQQLDFSYYYNNGEKFSDIPHYWGWYLMFRRQYVAQNPKQYIYAPGMITPSFKEELFARSELVDFYQKNLKTGEESKWSKSKYKYMEELTEAKKAGFLKEYVWVFLKRDHWEKPKGLELTKFKEWQNKNIPDHKVETIGDISYSHNVHRIFRKK